MQGRRRAEWIEMQSSNRPIREEGWRDTLFHSKRRRYKLCVCSHVGALARLDLLQPAAASTYLAHLRPPGPDPSCAAQSGCGSSGPGGPARLRPEQRAATPPGRCSDRRDLPWHRQFWSLKRLCIFLPVPDSPHVYLSPPSPSVHSCFPLQVSFLDHTPKIV